MESAVSASIHPTAEVSPAARIGENTRIWHQAQVRERAIIGRGCNLGKGVYIDFEVQIGDHCKLQNGVFVYHGFTVEEGAFLGPGVICLNDKTPRSVNPDLSIKADQDWTVSRGSIGRGASIGGGSVILPGVQIGAWALVGAGSIVTRDVPDHGLVYGNPARLRGFVCRCGQPVQPGPGYPDRVALQCPACGRELSVPLETYRRIES